MARPNRNCVKLLDLNGYVMRHVSQSEARRLIDDELARDAGAGWYPRRRDVTLTKVQLVAPRLMHASPTTITFTECEVNAGVYSDNVAPGRVSAIQSKIEAWPFIGDNLAPRVGVRV